MNAGTGLLLLRALEKQDYAWVTIVNSLLATINILADSGLGSAMSSLGGPIYQDQQKFAELLKETRRLRYLFLLCALVIVVPAGVFVLLRNEAPLVVTFVLIVILLSSAVPATEIVMLTAANRLHSRLRMLLVADGTMSFSRFSLVLAGWCLGMGAVIASLTACISQWLQHWVLRKQTKCLTHISSANSREFRQPMLRVVKQAMPISAFHCFQGHITTWILSLFASNTRVADAGALSRLSIITAILLIPFYNVMLPALARATDVIRLRHLAAKTMACSTFAAVALVLVGTVCSSPILWLLGPRYFHLNVELIYYLGYLALGFISAIIWGIVLAKSWVKKAWYQIPLAIVAQILAACLLDLSSVRGAVLMASVSLITGIIVGLFLIVRGIKETKVISRDLN